MGSARPAGPAADDEVEGRDAMTSTSISSPSIVQALSAVMEDVRAVGKDGRNQQQNYAFRGADAVVNAVAPAFRRHGVVCMPSVEEERWDSYQTKTGAQMVSCKLKVRFTFYGPAGDNCQALVWGESSDSGDKSTPKAHTVAYRTALLEALCIPTDDPDPDSQSHERAVPLAPAAENPDELFSTEMLDRFLGACEQHGVSATEVVEVATNGRTNDPAELILRDFPALKPARAAVMRRMSQP